MIKVGVIRGGVSPQYDSSLTTGGHILSALRHDDLSDKYKVVDMFLDKEGVLHMGGVAVHPSDIHNKVDIVFNALHGEFGSDGKLQQILDQWRIPYTGSGIFPSALSHNQKLSKYKLQSIGLQTPQYIGLPAYSSHYDGDEGTYAKSKAREVWSKMPAPWTVRPIIQGSSMGIHVCKTFEDLVRALERAARNGISVIVEELILGKRASVAVVENFRNQNLYALPSVEHRDANYICPAKFPHNEKAELERLAKFVHNAFGLAHYSNINFAIHPKKGIYILDVETTPSLDADSHTHYSLQTVGSSLGEFVDHIVQLALQRGR